MRSAASPEPVSFLTVEEGDDLILAFAIEGEAPGEVTSVILLRTPKFEALLPEEEWGVSVSHDAHPEYEDDRLRRIHLGTPLTEIVSTRARYILDLSHVDSEELALARRVLKRMNFDDGFVLQLP